MAFCSYPIIAMCLGVALGAIASATPAFADEVGQIKVRDQRALSARLTGHSTGG
jgi:hypothetical protein